MQYRTFFTLFGALLLAGTTANAQQRHADPGARPSVNPAERIDLFFNRLDKNQDGNVSQDEIPDSLEARLSSMDRDRDGSISRVEFVARFQQRPGSPAARDNNAQERPQAGRGGGRSGGRSGSQPPAARDNNAPQRPQAGRSGGRAGGRSGSQQGQNRQHDGSTPSRGQAQQGQRGPQQQGQGGPQRHDDGHGGPGARQGPPQGRGGSGTRQGPPRGTQQFGRGGPPQGRGGPGAQQFGRGGPPQGRGGPGAQQGQRGPQQDRGNREQGKTSEASGDFQGFLRRIKAAVESGAMTREEAAEKISEFRRSRGGDDRGRAEDPRQGDGQRERDGNRESNQSPPGRDR